MPTDKLQILTPIVTSVNGNTGDITVPSIEDMKNLSTKIDTNISNTVTNADFNNGTFSFKNFVGEEQFSVTLPIYNGEEL